VSRTKDPASAELFRGAGARCWQESPRLVGEVVAISRNGGGWLTLGVEVANDQQGLLGAALAGECLVFGVEIRPIVNHEGLRELLRGLRALKGNGGACLPVLAVDAGPGETRDETKAARLAIAAHDRPSWRCWATSTP
jgi:hypothetical protein